jgi:DNA-nicking Smr family endonuclease
MRGPHRSSVKDKPGKPTSSGAPAPARASRASAEGPRPLPEVQRREARRIASGVIEIEARLDLHGSTQSVAHARLVTFLQGSAQRGLKTVLVITGKGAGRERTPAAFAEREREDIGVLRRSVPRWLAEAPLRGLVISYQTAAPRHGGDGAFYILLRRSRRSRG